jgi:hypothetical protein
MTRRLPSWLLVALLGTPLLGLTVWIVRGALRGGHGRVQAPRRVAATVPSPAGAPVPGLPAPSVDVPAERLEEHVDGAADALRADGCRRLVAWRFERPPADAEALFFATAEGARAVLEREAGTERTPGPGDEAQVSAQAVYFRRGTALVRVFLDPGASPPAGELLARAQELDRALQDGGPL